MYECMYVCLSTCVPNTGFIHVSMNIILVRIYVGSLDSYRVCVYAYEYMYVFVILIPVVYIGV